MKLKHTKTVVIGATKGERTIVNSNLFTRGIDHDFFIYGCTLPSKSKKEREVNIYELEGIGTFTQIYQKMCNSDELKQSVLTQDQILEFVETHQGELQQNGLGNFFLIRNDGKFYVVSVYYATRTDLSVSIYQFSDPHIWNAGRYRFIL